MRKKLVMTPGPTEIHESVRRALSRSITNPDLDEDFFEFYNETCQRLKQIVKTKNDVLILNGEGILGLEAACASLIEPGDRVLCLDNGIFGHGFQDFVKLYGGEAVTLKFDYRRGIDPEQLANFLEKDHQFKLATLIHCETPSGITNSIEALCPLIKSYGIITVVDSVSAVGGEPLQTDDWKIDVLLGGSQKCLSAPPGLTFLSISQEAWDKIQSRKTPIQGYYVNLAHWANWYENKCFPYTQPISELYGLRAAIDRWLRDPNPIGRHEGLARSVRQAFWRAEFTLYPLDSFSNTVTTVMLPQEISFKSLYQEMNQDHGILIGGALGYLKDQVFRIGHMGENCHEDKLYITLKALDQVLRKRGAAPAGKLHHYLIQAIDEIY